MSVQRKDFGTKFEMFAGTTKTFQLTIKDPDTGNPFNLSDTNVFATGVVKIIKPNGTIISNVSVTYSDRNNGVVEFTITSADATNLNAGNWRGEIELLDIDPKVIEQQQFNFDIIESY